MKNKLIAIAKQVRKEIEKDNGDKNPELYGTCIDASDMIVSKLKDIGIDGIVIEGWVSYDIGSNCSDRSWDEHCWVEVKENDITWYVDVTATQFNGLMCTEFEPIIVSKTLPKSMSYDEPTWDDVD